MMKNESGRSLSEMICVLAVMGVMSFGTIKIYNNIVNNTKAQNTAKTIQTIAFERQNGAVARGSSFEATIKGPHSSLHVQNGSAGNHPAYFWVETTLPDADFCEALKKSDLIQADLIEVDNITDGNCKDNSKIAFYFKKNAATNVYCPAHSTNCGQLGDATGCEAGYYLSQGSCHACPEHVATCEDKNTPTSCEDGYTLYGSVCSDVLPCTEDTDCDVCGECGQDGYCTNMCEVPAPDTNNSCGSNACMVYDNATGTCQYRCTRVEYLESTGTQYIDTGVIGDQNSKVEITAQATGTPVIGYRLFGARTTSRNRSFFISTNGSNDIYFDYGNQDTWPTCDITQKHEYVLDKGSCYVDGSLVATLATSTFTTPTNLIFFGGTSGGTNVLRGWKIWGVKLYNNGSIIRDFIPVLDWNMTPCMYDKVSKQLFYNQGTGEFLYPSQNE